MYVLYNNQLEKYYIGYSTDLKNRINEHQLGNVKSTKTDPHNYKLKFYAAIKTKELAIDFERYLKSGSGVAFMKKRFLNSFPVAFEKD